MKNTKIIGGVLVLGILWAGSTWYTGTRLAPELEKHIAQANEKLQALPDEMTVQVSLLSLEQGFFQSTARYRLAVSHRDADAADTETKELFFTDRIEHGPFPWARLSAGQVMPVMFSNGFELEKNDLTQPVFELSQGVTPLSGRASMSYGGDYKGVLTIAPMAAEDARNTFDSSGMALDFAVTERGAHYALAGKVNELGLKSKLPAADVDADGDALDPRSLVLQGLAFSIRGGQSPSTLWLGDVGVGFKQLDLDMKDAGPVQVTNYAQSYSLSEDDGAIKARINYETGMLSLNGQELAGGRLTMFAGNLNTAEVVKLVDLYKNAVLRKAQAGDTTGDVGLTPEERQSAAASTMALLAGNPTFRIEPLLLRTPSGESTFTLDLELGKPAENVTSIDEVVTQVLRKVDARLSLSKPMMIDFMTQMLPFTNPAATALDPANVAAEVNSQVNAVSALAIMMGMASLEGDALVSNFGMADGEVNFNGRQMPLTAFVELFRGKF